MEVLKDFWFFYKERRKWWLSPLVFLFMVLIIFLFSSTLVSFIYPICFMILFFFTKKYLFILLAIISLIIGLSFKHPEKIILPIFFYLFFTPLALIRKMKPYNFLWLKNPRVDSYWKEVNKKFKREDLEKMW